MSRSDPDSQRTDVDAPMPWVPTEGERVGKHIVVDTLGEGAMGVVVRAYDGELDRAVAIKVVRPRKGGSSANSDAARTRLLAEARALARVSHPNVVTVYEVGLHRGLVSVAMELVEGCDLHRWLRIEPRSWREVLEVMIAIGRGLEHVHAAGLVHRDVKPANILVGDDGRARVGDFGLARARTLAPLPSIEGVELEPAGFDMTATECTAEGRVMGTPAYMAPEQHADASVGPSADQFAFAVVLYEALYGVRPYRVDHKRLVAAKQAGPPLPAHPKRAPKWVWPIVARALAPDPARRFASMGELCDALRTGGRRRRIAAALAAGSIVAASATWIATRPDRCADVDRALDGVWDPATRDAVADVFAASAHPWASPAWVHAQSRLDDYAARWLELRREACELGDADPLLDRRQLCLQSRLHGVAAVTEQLASGAPDVVEHTFELVEHLRPLAPCRDAAALASAIAAPEDPALALAVEEARRSIAEGRASIEAGRIREAVELGAIVLAQARALDHPPLVAEALAFAGAADQRVGQHAAAVVELEDAVWLALAIGHDEVASEAAIDLVYGVGRHAVDVDAALRWARLARAALDRRSDDPQRARVQLDLHVGTALETATRYDEALQAYEAALRRAEADPAMVVPRAQIHDNLAGLWIDRGEVQRARTELEPAIAELEQVLGDTHPRVARMRGRLAMLLETSGDHARAAELLQREIADLGVALGDDAPSVAHARLNLAIVLGHLDRREEGRVLTEQAVTSLRKAGDSPGLATALGNLGHDYFHNGAYDVALDRFTESVAMYERIYGADHPEIVSALVGVARVRLVQKRLDEAEAAYVRADEIVSRAQGPWARSRGAIFEDRALVAIDRGRRDEADALLVQALAIARRAPDATPGDLPFALQQRADNLLALGRRAEARTLAEEALTLATANDDAHRITVVRELLARIDA
ncbi:MAG TPA: serine/threonine-protein kinase [Nannocystaceae bacterium]|nr:serine/threonine-protein kinase [Nannocystaceae bacterium]